MAYEYPSDTVIAVDKPVRASDIRKIRDMVPGLAAGDAGAPKIQPEALEYIPVGANDSYQDVSGSRTHGTAYQNNTGQNIEVVARIKDTGSGSIKLEWSSNGSSWVTIAQTGTSTICVTITVADGEYYRTSDTGGGSSPSVLSIVERRP